MDSTDSSPGTSNPRGPGGTHKVTMTDELEPGSAMKAITWPMLRSLRSRRPSNEPEESSPGTSPHSRGRHLDVERLRAGLDGNPGGTRRRSGSGGKHIFSNLFGLLSWQTKASQSASALADKDPGPGSAVAAASGDAQAGAALSMSSLLDFGDDDDSFRRRRRRRRSCLISPDDAWLAVGLVHCAHAPIHRRLHAVRGGLCRRQLGTATAYSSSAASSTSSSCWTCPCNSSR